MATILMKVFDVNVIPVGCCRVSIFLVYLALAIREPSPAIHSNRGDVNVVQGDRF